jgi:hypothetical protein
LGVTLSAAKHPGNLSYSAPLWDFGEILRLQFSYTL